ncbi:hypothetical protein FRC20_000418, partial [Serendipita sp. 405]
MPPSASKQKRLAEKAAKQSVKKANGASTDAGTSETPTGSGSARASTTGTPMTNRSAAGSQEDLMSMEKLKLATD